MRYRIRNTVLRMMVCLTMLCGLPASGWSMLVVQTRVVSGHIVNQQADHSVRLDDGKLYIPSRKELAIDLAVGSPVTLRYYIEGSKQNVYFEYAPGLNSLQESKPALPVSNKQQFK